MHRRISSIAAARAGCVVLAIVLVAGCAGVGKLRPPSAKKAPAAASAPSAASLPVAPPPPAAPAGPSVARFGDAREGFVITETPSLDAESRRDFERAIALMKGGQHAEAIPVLQQVIARSPGVTGPHINLAIACRSVDRPEEAEQHLKTALTLLPGHPVASNEYGLLLRKSGRFAEARTVYETALAAYPEYLPARRNLGILCDLYLNDLACALEQYEIYSEAKPDDAQVKLWVADLRARLGR